MAKPKKGSLEARLQALAEIRHEPHTPEAKTRIERALNSKTGLMAATAAEIVKDHELSGYAPLLEKAFFRFLENPVKTDAQCRAKRTVVEALDYLEADSEDVFRAGLKCVQSEPSWGGTVDTGADVRAVSAWALTRLRPHDLMHRLVDLLADPERGARLGAVRALHRTGRIEAELALRLKVRMGDPEIEVIGQCFEALLDFDQEENLALLQDYLFSKDEALSETAALALGQSKQPGALAPLVRWTKNTPFLEQKDVGFVALASHRSSEAVAFLLEQIADADEPEAERAARALSVLKHDPEVATRLRTAAKGRSNDRLARDVENLLQD